MKKALIISYYWPPSGGPGSQRALKFAKYLPHFGWQPIILTVLNGEFPYIDWSFESDIPSIARIYRTKSWEPFALYKKLTGHLLDESLPVGLLTIKKESRRHKLATWLRANFFIPDARIGWIPFVFYQGLRIIKNEKISLIFTSSPPHSLQLGALFLKKKSGIPWIADLRDPWTAIRYYQAIKRMRWAKKADSFFEKQVIKNADRIITVSKALVEDFQKMAPYIPTKLHVLPNGYDEDDFKDFTLTKTNHFDIVHSGNMLSNQNPDVLWQSLHKLFIQRPELRQKVKIKFIGRIHEDIKKSINDYNLQDSITIQGFIPHQQVLHEIYDAAMQLMVVPKSENNKGVVTSKFFEYIGSGKPILAIGPEDSDVAHLISDFRQSIICDYQNEPKCSAFIEQMYNLWLENRIPLSEEKCREPFSRRLLTKQLVEIFNAVSEK